MFKTIILLPPLLVSLCCKAQNVGIGTTDPTAKLQINSTDTFSLKLTGHNLSNSILYTDSMAVIDASGNFKKAVKPSGSGSGNNYVQQSTAPFDSTTFWLDDSSGVKGVWPLKQKIKSSWRIIKWYDPIANFFSEKRPLYVLGTGQSNMIYRVSGGELSIDNRVIEFKSGAWTIANRVSDNANNIALQFAKQVAKKENRVVRFVVIADVSKPIEDWYAGGSKTIEISSTVADAQIDSFDVILLRQGEQNATLGDTEAAYAAKISQVFNAYRDSTWFGPSGIAVLGGLNESYFNTGVFNYYQHLNNGNKQGVDFVSVDMLGLSQVDGIHISGASIDTVGLRYYKAYKGESSQYALEKTPNVGYFGDAEIGISSISAALPAIIRLQQSSSNGRRGGFIKFDIASNNLLIGGNPTNNGTTSNDTIGIFVNSLAQVGIGNTNNTLTTNRSQFHIRSNQPVAFSVGSGRDNGKLQVDSTGSFIKPLFLSNQYQKDGNIIIQHQSGDIENGRIRFTRLSTPTSMSYNGMYIHYNGSTALLHLGAHGSTDTIVGNDVNVISIDQTGRGLSIKKGTIATAYLDIAASTGAANTGSLRLNPGILLVTPVSGVAENPGTRLTFTGSDLNRGTISLTFTGTGAPATTPFAVGDHFIDTTNKKEYVATGTASSADWTILN